jgi:hypothetical protein
MSERKAEFDHLIREVSRLLDDHDDKICLSVILAALNAIIGSIKCKGCRDKAMQAVEKAMPTLRENVMSMPGSGDHLH